MSKNTGGGGGVGSRQFQQCLNRSRFYLGIASLSLFWINPWFYYWSHSWKVWTAAVYCESSVYTSAMSPIKLNSNGDQNSAFPTHGLDHTIFWIFLYIIIIECTPPGISDEPLELFSSRKMSEYQEVRSYSYCDLLAWVYLLGCSYIQWSAVYNV